MRDLHELVQVVVGRRLPQGVWIGGGTVAGLGDRGDEIFGVGGELVGRVLA
jgi:hypothetical protein